jgi:protein-tyrosine-phosphatase/DNA-binding transcriptional ArsR family regulator
MYNRGVTEPPAFLQLAGHPLRWQLLSELGRSDRMVHELTDLVGSPQNLVSYHLAKLRDAGLVTSRRSSADRRGAYYSVDLARIGELLVDAGLAVHPGLRLAPATTPTGGARRRVLFLCTGNSARSQMAEALARSRSDGLIEAVSAGSRPKPLHPHAVRVMDEAHGIDLTGQRPKHVRSVARRRYDLVVSLCDRVREVCPGLPGAPEAIHWSIPDPTTEPGDDPGSYPAFQRTAAELERRIGFLVAALLRPSHP